MKKLAPTTYILIHTRHKAQFYQHQIWIQNSYNCVGTNYYSTINAVTHTWRAFRKALNEKAPVNLALSIWNAIPVKKNCIHTNLISKVTLLLTRSTQILGTQYLWILNVELAECHPSGTQHLEVGPTLLENFCTPVFICFSQGNQATQFQNIHTTSQQDADRARHYL